MVSCTWHCGWCRIALENFRCQYVTVSSDLSPMLYKSRLCAGTGRDDIVVASTSGRAAAEGNFITGGPPVTQTGTRRSNTAVTNTILTDQPLVNASSQQQWTNSRWLEHALAVDAALVHLVDWQDRCWLSRKDQFQSDLLFVCQEGHWNLLTRPGSWMAGPPRLNMSVLTNVVDNLWPVNHFHTVWYDWIGLWSCLA